MISSIAIENFKAFGKKQKLPIKPITLIFGPNSSGKSSIIHSLLFAQHALETGNLDVFRTTGGGDSVDLGGFKQYIFKGNTENLLTWSVQLEVSNFKDDLLEFLSPAKTLEISISVNLPKEEVYVPKKDLNPKTQKWEIVRVLNPDTKTKEIVYVPSGEFTYSESPTISSFSISADGKELLYMGARKGNFLRMDRISQEHPVLKNIFKSIIQVSTTVQNILPEDYDYLKEGLTKILPKMEFTCEKFFPKSRIKSDSDSSYFESSLIPISMGNRKESIISTIELILPRKISKFLKDLNNEVCDYFENIVYLGPVRSYPSRHLAFLEDKDSNWYAGGGFAWEVLRKNSRVREKVNAWLGDKDKLQTPYRLDIKEFAAFEEISSEYLDAVEELEQRFTDTEKEYDWDLFGELYSLTGKMKQWSQKRSNVKELLLRDLRTDTTVSHRDVGFGISQIIPVLVSAYAYKNKMIAIEQPEIHTHPKLQAELGDIFIESALGEQKNTFLLETHSEHLILRILRRIRETAQKELPKNAIPIRPQDVSVIYAKPTKEGALLYELPVNEEGEFTEKWPDGFFAERADELF